MAEQTAIEWCDSTFNPWIGCTKVSPACDDCYAARSTPARTLGVAWGAGERRRRTAAATWDQVKRWAAQPFVQCPSCGWRGEHRHFHGETGWTMCPSCSGADWHGARRRVFCASLADWLDNDVPIPWLVDLLQLIHDTPSLDWLLLSKRIGNWSDRIAEAMGYLDEQGPATAVLRRWLCQWLDGDEAPQQVWLGATMVNQPEWDRDVGKLLAAHAARRFVSIEPMLGAIDVNTAPRRDGQGLLRPLDGRFRRIDWVICGGESGPKARPMHPDWARSLRDQCAGAGVPFLFKQHGEWIGVDDLRRLRGGGMPGFGAFDHCRYDRDHEAVRVGKTAAGRLLDGRTHDGFPGTRHD